MMQVSQELMINLKSGLPVANTGDALIEGASSLERMQC